MLAGSCLFRELLPAQRRGFVPAAAGGIYALLGLIFVLQADGGMRAALLLALRLTLLVVSIRALCPAEENARLRPYAAAVCLLAGLVRVELPFGVPLAAVEAAAVCLLADSMEDALLIGAACGLVLDLGSVPSPPQTACFCLPLLVCRMANLRRTARAAAFARDFIFCACLFGAGSMRAGRWACWQARFSHVCFPALRCRIRGGTHLPRTSTLVQTADVLQQMETKLSLSCPQTQTAPALIFDSAADDVCRSCVKRQQCWQERADDTCRLLSACAGTIMRQGQANAGDLPAGFCAVCIREEAFRAAVNRALRAQESQLLALQRSEEAREISRALLGQLARFLRAAGQKRPDKGIPRYQLSLGVRASAAGRYALRRLRNKLSVRRDPVRSALRRHGHRLRRTVRRAGGNFRAAVASDARL